MQSTDNKWACSWGSKERCHVGRVPDGGGRGAWWGYLSVGPSRFLHGLEEANSLMRFQIAHAAAQPQHAQHGGGVPVHAHPSSAQLPREHLNNLQGSFEQPKMEGIYSRLMTLATCMAECHDVLGAGHSN